MTQRQDSTFNFIGWLVTLDKLFNFSVSLILSENENNGGTYVKMSPKNGKPSELCLWDYQL